MTAASSNQPSHPVTIEVHNEDTGGDIKLTGDTSHTVQTFIDQLYSQLRTTRKNGDRLRCKQVNVFSFASLMMAAFEKDQCSSHSWTFAGETGGAACCPRR
jgi:hypothetical protein